MPSRAFRCVFGVLAGVSLLASASPRPAQDRRGEASGDLFVVAHQDDETYFLEPDLDRSQRSGKPVEVVFVTAGSSGEGSAVWQARERQSLEALAIGAGRSSSWQCAPRSFVAGKSAQVCRLYGTRIDAVYLRLPDGALGSLWVTEAGRPFPVQPVSALATADGASTYTRAEVLQALARIFADFAPARLGTMDSTFAYGDDHADHAASALFALEAAHAWGHPHTMRIYRGYSVAGGGYHPLPQPEQPNLSKAEIDGKLRALSAYGLNCSGSFAGFCPRRYAISRVSGGTGPLRSGNRCLDAARGAAVSSPCSGASTQIWSLAGDGTLRAASGRCLELTTKGARLALATCDGAPRQSWTLFSNGQLRGENGACLTRGRDTVSMEACAPDRTSSQWMPQPLQRWVQVFGLPSAWSADRLLAKARPAVPLRLADLDGDGYSDVCFRLSDGVHCALNSRGGGFAASALWSTDFSDAAGWRQDAYGTTVQLGDVDGDGLADLCGRGPGGIVCALARRGGGFGPVALWTSDFSDAAGFAQAASYYGSIRLGDLNGDGLADICGRGPGGVSCALNTGKGSFAPATPWAGDEFSDALGWLPERYGATLQLGDIDGDGLADVCARGPSGVRCALASPAGGFLAARAWSWRGDFSDAEGWGATLARWGSLRLADVDGDGLADLCGRGPQGLVCGLSNGAGFDGALLLAPDAFGDGLGFGDNAYGGSLAMGDLDRDGRDDACIRSRDGLICAKAAGAGPKP